MRTDISHFAINADDVGRARRFYERVFGWTFEPWGPPDFFQIDFGSPAEASAHGTGVRGALQRRRELKTGQPTFGFECTFAVDDLDRIMSEVAELGGRVIVEPTAIAGVGHLVFFEDTEGNVVGAMRYDSSAE